MSVRILIGAAIVTGGWLSACSRPAPGTAAADRQIQLAQPAATSDTAVVSDIEAGRPAKVATAVHRQPARRLSPAALMAAEMNHAMGGMTSSEAVDPGSLGLAAAPRAAALPVVVAEEPPARAAGAMTMSRHYQPPGGFIPSDNNYGPMVLIRGGMGGILDKCDERGTHRGGTAVNRAAPSFGPPGGIR